MVLKIYGNWMSTTFHNVLVVLKELDVPYEIVTIDFWKGDQRKPEYLAKKHPYGRVPVLEDEDGLQIFESRAIARYIVAEYGNGKLIPKGRREVALFEQAVSVEGSYFDPYVSGIAYELYIANLRRLQPDEARAAKLTKDLEDSMKVYDVILSKQEYVAGNEFTLADIFHLGYGWLITEQLGVQALKSPETPNVARWWAKITDRDSWKAVLAEMETLKAQQ